MWFFFGKEKFAKVCGKCGSTDWHYGALASGTLLEIISCRKCGFSGPPIEVGVSEIKQVEKALKESPGGIGFSKPLEKPVSFIFLVLLVLLAPVLFFLFAFPNYSKLH